MAAKETGSEKTMEAGKEKGRWEDEEWGGWAGEAARMGKWADEAEGPLGGALASAAELSGQSRLAVWTALLLGTGLGLQWVGGREAAALSFLLGLVVPVPATLAVMEVAEARVQAEWLFFWLLWAAVQMVPGAGTRLLLSVWLAHPATRGAALLFAALARPLLLLQHGLVSPAALRRLEPHTAALLGLEPAGLAAPEPAVLARAGLALHRPPAPPPLPGSPPAHLIHQLPSFVSRLHLLARISRLPNHK